MPPTRHIKVRVWGGDYGLPSVDPLSLQLLTLFKVHGIIVDVSEASFPAWVGIPSITCDNVTVTDENQVYLFAFFVWRDTYNSSLNERQRRIQLDLENRFQQTFAEMFTLECWINTYNFEYSIKPCYKRMIPFPFGMFYVTSKRKAIIEKLMLMLGQCDPAVFRNERLKAAASTLKLLEAMLQSDDQHYFFATDIPMSLDIVVYSYLVVTLHMPMADSVLQYMVNSRPRLLQFVGHMNDTYFPDISAGARQVEKVPGENDCVSRKMLITVGISITAVMLLYSYKVGLIKPLSMLRSK